MAVEVHMPEAVLRGGETLGEEQIGFGLCFDVGDAPGVAVDGDGVFEGWEILGGFDVG